MDVNVETYRSGCSGGYCFVISDYNNSSEQLAQSSAKERCQSVGALLLIELKDKDIQDSLVNFTRSVGLYSQAPSGWNVLTDGKRSSSNWIRLNGNVIGTCKVLPTVYYVMSVIAFRSRP